MKAAPKDPAQMLLAALGPRAIETAAATQKREPADLQVAHAVVAYYPLQERKAFAYKIRDRRDGSLHHVLLDESGQILDPDELADAEQALRRSVFGKFDPPLAAHLQIAAENDAVPVLIWAHEAVTAPVVEPLDPSMGLTVEEAEALQMQIEAARRADVALAVAPVADFILNLGHIATADEYAPVVYAALPPAILKQLADRPDVDTIYLSQIQQPELSVARQVIRAHFPYNRGIRAFGVQVAQIEVGGRVVANNPYINELTQNTTFVCAAASAHSTSVAGIIASDHATDKGIAAGCQLWAGGSCGGVDSELQDRSTAAANWGASVLNLSWGSDTNRALGANDRFYDDFVINRSRTVVKSAGNNGGNFGTMTGNITSPGLGFNVIAVGNFNDQNTVDWNDDAMHASSSFNDPTSTNGDREKPEVAAPGTTINSLTTAFPWIGDAGFGTSFAAPMVTGTAALMMQQNTALKTAPEAVKAILMATAVHNIEGNARLSDVDGAGGIDANQAVFVAGGTNGNWGTRAYDCNSPTPLDVATIALTAGRRTRVVIAWPTDPAFVDYATRPCADLDLQVLSPTNGVVASSLSFDNSYEIVDFTPAVTGNFTIRVTKFRCSLSPRRVAWAWHRQ